MNQSDVRIAAYADAVARRLAGSKAERRKATEELRELLADAAEAGELTTASNERVRARCPAAFRRRLATDQGP